MTMDKMVEEFKKKGFKASKKYESKEKHYRFEIEKDGICEIGYFIYKLSGESYGDFTTRQRCFIETLISSWEETKATKTNSVNFDNELFNRGGRAYISLEMGDSPCIPVCIERINYTTDECPSFEGHFRDIFSEYPVTKASNSQNTIKEDKDNSMKIKVVHFSGGVTTVIWEDGTKSQVRCQDGDDFDPEKGLALAIAKRILGNKGSWYDEIKKWTDKYYTDNISNSFEEAMARMKNSLKNCTFQIPPLTIGNTVKYVGPQDSDEANHADKIESPEPTAPTTPTAHTTPHHKISCATCRHFHKPIDSIPCSGCDMSYSCWEAETEELSV